MFQPEELTSIGTLPNLRELNREELTQVYQRYTFSPSEPSEQLQPIHREREKIRTSTNETPDKIMTSTYKLTGQLYLRRSLDMLVQDFNALPIELKIQNSKKLKTSLQRWFTYKSIYCISEFLACGSGQAHY
ncbi:hypothetical protein J6590_014422 [Homalodisca vitripennis]|nr:hypothetical protein J6590_014422 [Homalodisca vitripennis]